MQGIYVLGSDTGVEVINTAGGSLFFEAINCVFARNRTGLLAPASDGQALELLIENCSISDFSDGTFNLVPAPRLLQHEIGVNFEAVGSGGTMPPEIVVNLMGLMTEGSFETTVMNPIPPRGVLPFGLNDYPSPGEGGLFTRVVQVYARGDENRREYPGSSSTTVAIPKVVVHANGGVWDGQSLSESQRGWDIGLYSVADRAPSAYGTNNYLCRYRVDLTGTIIEEMKLVGVYSEANQDTRGLVAFGDQTTIRRTGQQVTTSPDGFRHSGVYGLARKGLLRILGQRATIQDNVGCGIYYIAHETGRGPLPFGGLLGLDHCGVHNNKEDGIHLLAAKDTATLSRGLQGAVIGGTWDLGLSSSAFSFVPDSTKQSDPNISIQGQGYLNGCSINGGENGKIGIHVSLNGNAFIDNGSPGQDYSAASLRIVNTYVWNFNQEGYRADVTLPGDPKQGPLLLTPVVHSTFANNTGHSFNIVHGPVLGNGYTFYYEEPTGPQNYLNTSLNNCLFQRANSASLDLGPFLDTGNSSSNRWRFDNGLGNFRNRNYVYLAGLRAVFNTGYTPPDLHWLSNPVPFQGSPTGLLPDQWYLINSSNYDSRFYSSNNYLNGGSQLAEDTKDIENVSRPAYQSRDKGGEQN